MTWLDEATESEIMLSNLEELAERPQQMFLSKWFPCGVATDQLDSYARVVMLDFSKAFDFINHHLLFEKLQMFAHTYCKVDGNVHIGQSSMSINRKWIFPFCSS